MSSGLGSETFLEVEAKFAVDDSVAAPDLSSLSGVDTLGHTAHHSLSAIYYDTADLRLTRAKITLRRRSGGNDDGWHLKLPATHGRLELHAPLEDLSTPPAQLLSAVRAIVRREPLAPIAQIDNNRAETQLLGADGGVVAEFCDDRVTAWSLLPGGQQTSWREWEVELGPALAESLDGGALIHEATTVLINAGARKSASASKLATALGTSVNNAPVPPAVTPLSSDSPAKAVVDSLRAQRDKLVEWDPRVRNDEWDSVHQMRVATRELRSLMETFEGILAGPQLPHLESELKELASLLGTARDAEVVEERFVGLLDSDDTGMVDPDADEHIRGDMRREYERAHRRIVRTLDSDRYLQLLDDIDALLANPPLSPELGGEPVPGAGAPDALPGSDAAEFDAESPSAAADFELPEVEAEADESEGAEPEEILYDHLATGYKKLMKRQKKAEKYYQDTSLPLHDREEYVHDVRKAAKKLRYSANAAKDSGLNAGKLSKACKQLQEVLGDFQDAVTSRDRIRQIAGEARTRGEDTFAYGMLFQREISRGNEALKGYPDAITEVKKAFKKVKPVKSGKKK
ncbi:CYTH and CHAD domain-containing protein [Corynebacterium sp. CCUG 70398]|uniref:CYTH and CHAD domain-containing protein n=1 Tax=Corynebacterium sp. CCUG 70398 TaxID=2823891 RepID=UPI00210B0B61|nr:CYTH and CHAD domain-containing protein [Corynebacterium sp. CCUG 70398]MCQ4622674.1 CYTH and CHAD domain-containing protein [Corynebacterium sp. CCUG 70398]